MKKERKKERGGERSERGERKGREGKAREDARTGALPKEHLSSSQSSTRILLHFCPLLPHQ
jgi:hypothetical protein